MNRWVSKIVVVTLLSVMVWVWAESESVQQAELTPTVAFVDGPEGTLVVRVLTPSFDGQVRLRIEGTTASLDRAERALAGVLELRPGVAVPSQPGVHRVRMADAIREVAEAGVSVLVADPEWVEVQVVRLVSGTAPIRLLEPDGMELDQVATRVNPEQVTVRLPERAEAMLAEGVEFPARLRAEELGRLREGQTVTLTAVIDVPSELLGLEALEFEPRTVQATVRVRAREESVTVDDVPVWVFAPPSVLGEFEVSVADEDRSLVNVVVTGPGELIDQIRNQELVIKAMVELRGSDLRRVVTEGQEEFEAMVTFANLPTSLRFETDRREVTVRVKALGEATDGGAALP